MGREVAGQAVTYTEEIHVNTPERYEIRCITDEVQRIIRESGVTDGLVLVNPMHITASVFINDDDKSTIARRGGATQRCHSGLLGMTGITLLYRDHGKERVVDIRAFDAGNAGCFELIPEYPTFEAHTVMRRARPLWRHV